jgi:hypothetical protein
MKKVTFGSKPSNAVQSGSIDNWVHNREAETREQMKRLTIDVPISLHKRIKGSCAMQNLIMADVIRELLEQRFPQQLSAEQGLPS